MASATLKSAPLESVLEDLETSRRGLSPSDARSRLEKHGPNRLPREHAPGWVEIILKQFKDPLIYVLLAATIVSLATGNINNALFIGAVLLVNATLGAIQEKRAASSAESLQEALSIQAVVMRGGEEKRLDAEKLVPGDIVKLTTGDAVPADARLLEAEGLRVDESLLTGESTPVDKQAEDEGDPDAPLAERRGMAHAGSAVLAGRGVAVVLSTGTESEVGRIAKSLAEREGRAPPLEVRLRKLTRLIAIFVLASVVVLGGLELARGEDLLQVFFLAVALAVSAIPAGLPIAITVALSRASKRMADQNVIVRHLPAVEGLGACTLVASDKTGTLTANRLTVRRLVLPSGQAVDVTGEGYQLEGELRAAGGDRAPDDETTRGARALAEAGALVNEARLREQDDSVEPEGDTVDVAFLVLERKLGPPRPRLVESQPRIAHLPFESERKFAASLHGDDEARIVYVKGAAEVVAEMCKGIDSERVQEMEDELARGGFRVLAVAKGPGPSPTAEGGIDPKTLRDLELLGLVGIIDPIREGVSEAVEACQSAGVSVRMVTGDHPSTGLAIANELGLTTTDAAFAMTGKELEAKSEGLRERIAKAPVFARVEPIQKTTIVEHLQEAGHFVAVTGDGANDAPALRAAHIGVAMGRSGTDVARGAADLILTDDNFASIVAGIREGRVAYENVRKVVWLLLATGAGEVLLVFLSLGFGLPLPLLPVQLLWLNLVTNGIQDVALAFEKGDQDVLRRGPRPPAEPIMNRRMIRQVLVSGGYIGVVGFLVFHHLTEVRGMEVTAARNLLLLLLVLFENVHIFSCRSERRSAFRVPIRANPLLVVTVLAAQAIHILAMYVPGISAVLEIQPVDLETWLTLFPIALSLLIVDELAKALEKRLGERGLASTSSGDEVGAEG